MDEQWEKIRRQVRHIYLEEDKTLKELMCEIKKKYGFIATKSQYETKLRNWGFQKNLTDGNWKCLAYHLRRRTHAGKESDVISSGRKLSDKRVQKAITRYSYTSTAEKFKPISLYESPQRDDLQVWLRTPSPEPRNVNWPAILPWFRFTDENKNFFGSIEMLPSVTNIMATLKMDAVSNAVSQLNITSTHENFNTLMQKNLRDVSKCLKAVMPGRSSNEHLQGAESLCRFGTYIDTAMILEIFLYFLSNNQVQWTRLADETILSLFGISNHSRLADLKQFVTSSQPTAQSLADEVYGAAVRLQDTYWMSHFVKAGFSIHRSIQARYVSGCLSPYRISMSALQMALNLGAETFVSWIIEVSESVSDRGFVEEELLLDAVVGARVNLHGGLGNVRRILHLLQDCCSDVVSPVIIGALQNATEGGYIEISRVILDDILDSMGENRDQKTVLHLLIGAILNQHEQLVNTILDNTPGTYQISAFGGAVLFASTKAKRIDICARLCAMGIDPNPISPALPSPLCQAAMNGDTEMMQVLLDHGAHINWQHGRRLGSGRPGSIYGWMTYSRKGRIPFDTAMGAAICHQQEKSVTFLISRGARFRTLDRILAIQHGFGTSFESLDGMKDDNGTLRYDGTVLEAAIVASELNIAYAILEHKAEVYDPGALCAAVYMSIKTGNIAIIHALLRRRVAPPADKDEIEGTACMIALLCSKWEAVDLLFSSPHRLRPHFALWDNNIEVDLSLSEYSQKSGWWYSVLRRTTVLAVAVEAANERAIHFLLQLGYKPTPEEFAAAAKLGNMPILKILLTAIESECDHSRLLDGSLAKALEAGHVDIFHLLLDNGADVQAPAPAYRGSTALQMAAINGYMGVAMELIQRGADLNAPGAIFCGRTALEGAAENGRIDMVALLLYKGVSTQGLGQRQYIRAIQFAANEGHHAVAKLLRRHRRWSDEDRDQYDGETLSEGYEYDECISYWKKLHDHIDSLEAEDGQPPIRIVEESWDVTRHLKTNPAPDDCDESILESQRLGFSGTDGGLVAMDCEDWFEQFVILPDEDVI